LGAGQKPVRDPFEGAVREAVSGVIKSRSIQEFDMSSLPERKYTVDEYFELERTSEIRYEYDNGEIFAMAGASRNHNRISKNITNLVDAQIQNRGDCESFFSDVRVRVNDLKYVYPDVFVVCGEQDIGREETVLNPSVVFEILSKSTRGYDRNGKFDRYKKIKTLTDYVMIAQDRIHILHHKRDGDTWRRYNTTVYTEENEIVTIESISCTLSVSEIYARVVFEALPSDDDEE